MTSGKTTAANYLCENYGFVRCSLASPLRELAAIHEGTNRATWRSEVLPLARRAVMYLYWNGPKRVFIDEMAEKLTDSILAAFEQFTPTPGTKNRHLLQYIGTEVGRNFDRDIWVAYLLGSLQYYGFNRIIVDDMRFRNEFEALSKAGFTTVRLQVDTPTMRDRVRRIYGPEADVLERYLHPSETELDDYIDRFDYVIPPDYSVRDLTRALDCIVVGCDIRCLGRAD